MPFATSLITAVYDLYEFYDAKVAYLHLPIGLLLSDGWHDISALQISYFGVIKFVQVVWFVRSYFVEFLLCLAINRSKRNRSATFDFCFTSLICRKLFQVRSRPSKENL